MRICYISPGHSGPKQSKTRGGDKKQKRPKTLGKPRISGHFIKWSGPGSNRRHMDFQSIALPTELPDRESALGAICPRKVETVYATYHSESCQ